MLLRGALARVRVRDVMTPDPVTVASGTTVGVLLDDVVWRHHGSAFPVLDGSGHVVGLVTLRHLRALPITARASTMVDTVAAPADLIVRAVPDEPLTDLLERIAVAPDHTGRALVFEGPRLVGIISPSDINRAIEIAALRAEPGPGVASPT